MRTQLDHTPLDKHTRDVLCSRIYDLGRQGLADASLAETLDWVEDSEKLLRITPQPPEDHRLYFSPGETCLEAILASLRAAYQTIKICVFTITDDRIVRALYDRRRMGVNLKIITDNDKRFDLGSDVEDLADDGFAVRVDMTPDHMHHKFAVLDGRTVLTGSYNWTRGATKNHENLLITNAADIVSAYDRQFDRLWDEMRAL